MAAQIEAKVQAATGAAAVSGLALWALGHYVFKAGVPDVVASWIYVLVPAVITFGAGYLAKHTSRPAVLPVITIGGGGGGGGGEYAAQKTLIPPAAPRGTDISPLADPPMEDLPGPVIPPAAPE